MRYTISAAILATVLNVDVGLASDFKAYPVIHYFDYTEYDDDGSFLDGETGHILGFGLSLAETKDQHGLRGRFELAGGTVDYDGETNTGIPHQTETDTLLFRWGLDYEYHARPDRLTLFAGADYVGWDRDILPAYNPLVGGLVGGLYEEYRWWELHVGIDAVVYHRNRHTWSARAETLYIADPKLTIPDLADLTLDLGSEPGFRLTGRYLHESPDDWSVGVEVYWEEWEFGRSSTVTVGPFTVFEPRSETSHRGARLIIEQRF